MRFLLCASRLLADAEVTARKPRRVIETGIIMGGYNTTLRLAIATRLGLFKPLAAGELHASGIAHDSPICLRNRTRLADM